MSTLRHGVFDSDSHFTINPVTREMRNEASGKTRLMQFDHNSERFTFEIPKIIEGHDMSQCNIIQIHYNNIDAQNNENQNRGVYEVDDMQVSQTDPNVVVLSWLISGNATQLAGALHFLVSFKCTNDGEVCYVWNTAPCTSISVTSGINNGEVVAEEYPDILAQWQAEIEELVSDRVIADTVVEAVADAVNDGTIGNFIEVIKTVDGTPMRFIICTKEHYDAMSDSEKVGLCAYITNDPKDLAIVGILNGTVPVQAATELRVGDFVFQRKPIEVFEERSHSVSMSYTHLADTSQIDGKMIVLEFSLCTSKVDGNRLLGRFRTPPFRVEHVDDVENIPYVYTISEADGSEGKSRKIFIINTGDELQIKRVFDNDDYINDPEIPYIDAIYEEV